MALTSQEERQTWFWTKEEVNITVNGLIRRCEALKKTAKRRGDIIIKLHKEIVELKQQLENNKQL